jgi:hypothetical protein
MGNAAYNVLFFFTTAIKEFRYKHTVYRRNYFKKCCSIEGLTRARVSKDMVKMWLFPANEVCANPLFFREGLRLFYFKLHIINPPPSPPPFLSVLYSTVCLNDNTILSVFAHFCDCYRNISGLVDMQDFRVVKNI